MKKRQWNPITYRCADYIRLTAMIYHRKAMDDMHGYAVMIYRRGAAD